MVEVIWCGDLFFFCKQKTAYEMRISDWSSDVCSSDLGDGQRVGAMLGGEDAHRGQLVPGPVIPAHDRLGNHRAQAQINRAVVALERCHAALIHQLPAPSSLIHVQYRTIMSRSGRGRSSSGLRGVPKNRNPAIRSGAAPNASRTRLE